MSIEEKRRAAFEAAFKLPDGMYWDEKQRQYAGGVMFWLYTEQLRVWNAALDSVAVDLPKRFAEAAPYATYEGGWNNMHEEAVDAIEAAGLKVAP